MKNIFFSMLCLLAFVAGPASAAVIIDPDAGLSGDFLWDSEGVTGTGLSIPLQSIDGDTDAYWLITLAAPGTIDVAIDDCCVPGDAFGLLLDSILLAPTSSTGGGGPGGTIFSAAWEGIELSAGEHRFDVIVTDSCCEGLGGASYSFSAVEVPAPATLALMGLGLVFLGRRGRARR